MSGPDDRFHRSDEPFFEQEGTTTSLKQLANVEKLVVFCGAGATIDRTGQDWPTLVESILKDDNTPTKNVSPDLIADIRATMDPLHAATTASRFIEQALQRGEVLEDKIALAIQRNLYRGNQWATGNLVPAIINLAVARSLRGLNTTIATTNYDNCIAQQYDRMRVAASNQQFPGLKVRTKFRGRATIVSKPASTSAWITIEYLHGLIPPPGETIVPPIAFSEQDYLATGDTTSKWLTQIFDSSGLLILGSSLTDPPLLNALLATKPDNTEPRCALMPIHSAANSATFSEAQAASLVRASEARMEIFSVDLLLPDFYCQVAQYVVELAVYAARKGEPGPSYGRRLEAWWHEWRDFANVDISGLVPTFEQPGDDDRPADESDVEIDRHWLWLVHMYHTLRQELIGIRDELGTAKRGAPEALKLELWVRVPTLRTSDDTKSPGRAGAPGLSRSLRLIAMSTGVIRDDDNPRYAALSVQSEYAAVKAFVAGRPGREELDLKRARSLGVAPEEARWCVFLSVPISIQFDKSDLPVGVLTLASNADKVIGGKVESRIAKDEPAKLEKVTDRMKDVGRQVLRVPKVMSQDEVEGIVLLAQGASAQA